MHLTRTHAYYIPNIMQNYILSRAYANFKSGTYEHSLRLKINPLGRCTPVPPAWEEWGCAFVQTYPGTLRDIIREGARGSIRPCMHMPVSHV